MTMRLTIMLAALLSCAGCATMYRVDTPPSFVEIDNDWDEYDYRATTADGLVIAVRSIDHDPEGAAEFWLKAIQNRMRDRGGYALLETVKVKSADGVEGTQLRFGHDEDGNKPHLYYLTLFVTDAKLFLLEAGGTKELMTAHAADVTRAVSSFDTTQ